MLALRGLTNIFVNVMEKLQGTLSREAGTSTATESVSGNEASLKFHKVHGKAIKISAHGSIARRSPWYFEHAVLFSNRPVTINRVVAVKVEEVTTYFHGPLRIGFTSLDPATFQNNVPSGRDLKSKPGVWLKSVHLYPMDVGTVIYFKVERDGTVLYGCNGVESGTFMKGVDTRGLLWVVVEAYGMVQTVAFVDYTMQLRPSAFEIEDYENLDFSNLNLTRSSRRYTRSLRQLIENESATNNNGTMSLRSRRNGRVTPLQTLRRIQVSTGSSSPSPNKADGSCYSPYFNPGLCIICTDREKNTAFNKCGHLCMCYECARAFKRQNTSTGSSRSPGRAICPICRGPIMSLLRIYS